MSFNSLLIHEVTIYNLEESSTTDRYGNPIDDPDAGTTVAARVQQQILQGSAGEDLRDRDTRVTEYRVFLPPDTEINALSTVEYDGIMHRVQGDPAIVDGRSGPHHIEAVVERITG